MIGWHFCRNDRRLGFGDGRHIRKGRTLKVEPPLKLCERGLHASKQIKDALDYSQGDVICRVKLSGNIIYDTDKAVATERTVLAMANASRVLHEFACCCAERALKKAKAKDIRSWNAIKTKRLWLKGKASDKELDAAEDAAWAAAGDAAGAAAGDAARDKARDTAGAAARDAAWIAARAAAWAAARAAARAAAGAAARDAAGDAEKKWQNKLLGKICRNLLKI